MKYAAILTWFVLIVVATHANMNDPVHGGPRDTLPGLLTYGTFRVASYFGAFVQSIW